MQPHVAFRVSNFWLNNYLWLRTNSSPKHQLNLSCDWLIAARHPNLPVARGLAVTLALLFLESSRPLVLSFAVLSDFSKLPLFFFSLFFPFPQLLSSATTTYGKPFQADCFNLIRGSYVAAVNLWAAVTLRPPLQPSFFLLPVLSPDSSIKLRSDSSNCSNCQNHTMNQKACRRQNDLPLFFFFTVEI